MMAGQWKSNALTHQLLVEIKCHYPLDWHGTHGVIHWCRVYENGMQLAEQPGVNRRVVQLFSVFHDSQRFSEGGDAEHGNRGAGLAARMREFYVADDHEFALLTIACNLHTSARNHPDITVQACFDADRLDLGRVGIVPDPDYLCTPLAKQPDFIESRYRRSLDRRLPEHPFELAWLAEL